MDKKDNRSPLKASPLELRWRVGKTFLHQGQGRSVFSSSRAHRRENQWNTESVEDIIGG